MYGYLFLQKILIMHTEILFARKYSSITFCKTELHVRNDIQKIIINNRSTH